MTQATVRPRSQKCRAGIGSQNSHAALRLTASESGWIPHTTQPLERTLLDLTQQSCDRAVAGTPNPKLAAGRSSSLVQTVLHLTLPQGCKAPQQQVPDSNAQELALRS